jgi:hypothetical protein
MCFYCAADILNCSDCSCVCCVNCGEDVSNFYNEEMMDKLTELHDRELHNREIGGEGNVNYVALYNNYYKLFGDFQYEHSKWCLEKVTSDSSGNYYCERCLEKRRRKIRRKQK